MESKKHNYYPDEDILYLNVGRKSHETVPRGDFHIDLDANNKVVGLEILNASKILSEITDENQTEVRKALENIQKGEIVVKQVNDLVYVIFKFVSKIDGKEVKQTIPVNIPNLEAPA